MTRKVKEPPQTKKERWQLAEYIAQHNLAAAERFVTAVEESYAFLADFPVSGSIADEYHPKHADVRAWQVKGFPRHLILFRLRDEAIEILHVCDAGRDLDAFLEQLKRYDQQVSMRYSHELHRPTYPHDLAHHGRLSAHGLLRLRGHHGAGVLGRV